VTNNPWDSDDTRGPRRRSLWQRSSSAQSIRTTPSQPAISWREPSQRPDRDRPAAV